jgi:hypothetical protein
MREVKGYLSNQFGFSETGRIILEEKIKPKIREIGITINDPFEICGREINREYLATLKSYDDIKKFWEGFSRKVTPINNKLMRDSDCQLAILDGGPAIDDGVGSEIGYYAGIERGPIFALRSDFRLGENISSPINPQIWGYIIQSRGVLAEGVDAMNKWFSAIKDWYDIFKQ